MRKPALTEFSVHELIRERWSPRSFADRSLSEEAVGSLLEAARWAPSAFNAQPWVFSVARREDEEAFRRLAGCLLPGNARWAAKAPLLVLTFARTVREGDGRPNPHAYHDLGLAVGNLTVQATALGLVLHQIAGIDQEAVRAAFALPGGLEPVTMLAIGYVGDPRELPEDLRERERAPRTRKPHGDLLLAEARDVREREAEPVGAGAGEGMACSPPGDRASCLRPRHPSTLAGGGEP